MRIPRERTMHKRLFGAIGLAIAMQMGAIAQEAPMTPLRPDQVAYFALYKELVETNTTLSAGSCTLAAERIVAHLKTAVMRTKTLRCFLCPTIPRRAG